MYVVNRTRATYLGVNVQVANTLLSRLRGLYPYRRLWLGDGLWIVPCTGIQTIGMRVPIDAIFLDKKGRVVRIYENLRPGRFIWWVPKSHSALELSVGSVRSSETRPGDLIELVNPDEITRAWPQVAAGDHSEQSHVPADSTRGP